MHELRAKTRIRKFGVFEDLTHRFNFTLGGMDKPTQLLALDYELIALPFYDGIDVFLFVDCHAFPVRRLRSNDIVTAS